MSKQKLLLCCWIDRRLYHDKIIQNWHTLKTWLWAFDVSDTEKNQQINKEIRFSIMNQWGKDKKGCSFSLAIKMSVQTLWLCITMPLFVTHPTCWWGLWKQWLNLYHLGSSCSHETCIEILAWCCPWPARSSWALVEWTAMLRFQWASLSVSHSQILNYFENYEQKLETTHVIKQIINAIILGR